MRSATGKPARTLALRRAPHRFLFVMRLHAPPLPPVLEYGLSQSRERYRRLLIVFRVTAFVCLFGWGYFITAVCRGSGAGSILPKLCIVSAVLVAPLAAIAFLGMRPRHYVVVLAALVV